MKDKSFVYRLLMKLGVHLSPKQYGDVSFSKLVLKGIRLWKNEILQSIAKDGVFLSPAPLSTRVVRPMLHRWRGVTVGKNVSINQEVIFDNVYPELITLDDGCIVSNAVQIVIHKRDYSDYRVGDNVNDLGYSILPTRIGKGATIGIGAIILGGVDIGDGAVVAAGAVVTKSIPPYSMAAGIPAKVLKYFPDKNGNPRGL
ncbi:MAG: acetyltransferase-like isoleucine patch superfamily enzyme [Algoriphagus sp.]|jgi:acetyltransferase-like isoleucine patch superfamily enzyme